MEPKLRPMELFDIEQRCYKNFELYSARLKKQFGTKEKYARYITDRWVLGKKPKSTRPKFKRLTEQEEKNINELCYLVWEKSPLIREEFFSKENFAAYEKGIRSGLLSE
ncbi:MAG: hypothetical protein WCV56_08355 [Candidatus Omnitrophota bacterium]